MLGCKTNRIWNIITLTTKKQENTQNFDSDLDSVMVVGRDRDSQEKEAFQVQTNPLYCTHKLINMTKNCLVLHDLKYHVS